MRGDDFPERFPRTAAVVQQGIERRLHPGAQIYISHQGKILADVGIGLASPDVPMTSDIVNPWLSAGKPLTAVLIAQLVDAGRLGWDDPVASHLPEFGAHGKAALTIRHLLTHTAGLQGIDSGWPQLEWNESLQRINTAGLDSSWVIGESAAYDPGSSWFVLGEIIQRLTGLPFADVLSAHVLQPAGLQSTWAALTPAEYERSRRRLGWMWERQQGQLRPTDWQDAPRCTRPSPGSSLRGPIRDLGRFYEWFQSREGRSPPFSGRPPRALAALTTPQRVGKFDQTLGHIVDFGLGFLLDSNRYGPDTVPYGYGRHCSPRTFGHGGSQCSQGYCDPEHRLVVAYIFNGRPGEGQHQRRARALNDAIYQDLMIARSSV